MHIFSIIPTICLFFIGFVIGLLLRFYRFKISNKVFQENRESKWSANFIITILNLVFILAGIWFTLYGNFLTSIAGSDNVTIELLASNNITQLFSARAVDFNQAINDFFGLLCLLVGIVVGILVWSVAIDNWGWFRNINNPKVSESKQQHTNIVDIKTHSNILKYLTGQKQAKADLDKFFEDLDNLKNGDAK